MIKSSTSIVVYGASGRMGSRIIALASDDPKMELRACVVSDASKRIGTRVLGALAHDSSAALCFQNAQKTLENTRECDCVIDFSSDEGSPGALALARALNAALLVGTTALSEKNLSLLRDESSRRPVLVSPNTSLGITVLADLVHRACKILGDGYQCSIVEAHHSAKKDAPSGTALRLAASVREAGHVLGDDQILAMRGGDVIGEHTVRLAGAGEYIELTHRATTRDLFARGALHCAAWLKGRSSGWYTMRDVAGLGA